MSKMVIKLSRSLQFTLCLDFGTNCILVSIFFYILNHNNYCNLKAVNKTQKSIIVFSSKIWVQSKVNFFSVVVQEVNVVS